MASQGDRAFDLWSEREVCGVNLGKIGAEGSVAHSSAVPANRVRVVSPGPRHGIGRRRRHVWLSGAPVELPVSTVIMLRSIADMLCHADLGV